jgi:hypothetical protein
MLRARDRSVILSCHQGEFSAQLVYVRFSAERRRGDLFTAPYGLSFFRGSSCNVHMQRKELGYRLLQARGHAAATGSNRCEKVAVTVMHMERNTKLALPERPPQESLASTCDYT